MAGFYINGSTMFLMVAIGFVCSTVNNNHRFEVSSFVVPSINVANTKTIRQAPVVSVASTASNRFRTSARFGNRNSLLLLNMADDAAAEDDDDDMSWMQGPPEGQPEMEIIECDVAIIGGGPAGCTCALYTSRADLSTVILDKNEQIGALAITSHIANYPGVDRSMSGMELLLQMKKQAIEYGTRICDRAQVFMIEIQDTEAEDAEKKDGEAKSNPYNKVVYTPDYTVKARSLVLATGAMGRSMPYLPGEEKYLGQGVSYCATCDGAFYRGSEVAVFGSTAEAMEEAMFLTKFASTVHWITPTDIVGQMERIEKGSNQNVEMNSLFDEGILKELLDQPNVKHHNKSRLREVEGDVSGVTGVRLQQVGSDEETTIPVEGAFIYGAGGGSKPITDFLSGSGIELDDAGGVVTDDSMESTTSKGVFAIGDIRNTPYKQVVVAASDGCVAAMSIEKFLKGRKIIKVDWVHK